MFCSELFFLFMLGFLITFRAVFFNVHTFRMFFLVPGSDVVLITANRAFKSDPISHSLASLALTCTIIAQVLLSFQHFMPDYPSSIECQNH